MFGPVSSLDGACQLVGEFIIENIIFTYSTIMHNNSILAYVTILSFFSTLNETNEKKNKKRYQQWIGKKQRLKRLLFYHSLIRYAYTFVILLSRYFMVIVKNEVYLISWDDFLFSFIAQMMPNKRFFFNF